MSSGFAIVTLPRSGSYHLNSLLDSAEDVICHGEIFKTNVVELRPSHLELMRMKKSDTAARNSDSIGFIKRLHDFDPDKIVGFKIFLVHTRRHRDLVHGVLNNPAWKKVCLFRNSIESYASLLRAKQTGVWVTRSGSQVPADRLNEKVQFTPDSFEQHIKLCQWLEKACGRMQAIDGNPVFRADYGLLGDESHLQQILSFIGSKTQAGTLKSDKTRQFSGTVDEGFSNWEEFSDYLRTHSMEKLLPSA